MNFANLIIGLFIILFSLIIFITTDIILFPIGNPFEQKNIFKPLWCKCKYNGPYEGNVKDQETGKPIENAFVIFWWSEKRKLRNYGIFYEIKKIMHTYTNSEGFFKVPAYPEKRNPYLCPPSFFIYKEGYVNLFFQNYIKNKSIKCFKEKKRCNFYLVRIESKDEEKYIGLFREILPTEIKAKLKEHFQYF